MKEKTMGIDTYVYTIYGVKVPWDQKFIDYYNTLIDPEEGEPLYKVDDERLPDMEADYMSGKFIYFGKKLFKSSNFRWDSTEGDIYQEIDPSDLMGIEQSYREQFMSFYKEFNYLLSKPFKIHTFISYC